MSNLKDIATPLANRYGLTRIEAETFIREMFRLVTDELSNGVGASVKIKGLGTFKLTTVSPRASVDVNTGERIMIDGRNKLSFTPDVTLRDRVNGPFAQFETVMLDADIDFSVIDNELNDISHDNTIEANSIGNNPSNDDTSIIVPNSTTGPSNESYITNQKQSLTAQGQLKPIQEQPIMPQEQPIPKEQPLIPQEQPDSTNDEFDEEDEAIATPSDTERPTNSSSHSIAHEIMGAKCPNRDKAQNDNNQDATTELSHTDSVGNDECHRHRYRLTAMVAASVLIVVAFVVTLGIFLHNSQEESNQRIQKLEASIKQHPAAQKSHDTQVVQDTAVTIAKADTTQSNVSQTDVKDKHKAEKQTNKISQDYDSDARIRTGAYIIVGISKTVKIQKGQTLASISKYYLGEGMECYVEAVNNYQTLRPGDSINIPQLKLKPRRH